MQRSAPEPWSDRASLGLVAVYVLLALLPLPLALLMPVPPRRPFWIELGVALGFIGLAMMGLQFLLTARFPSLSGRLGQDTLLQFHRQAGLVAAVLIFAHPVILIAANPEYTLFFDPRVNAPRAVALAMAMVLLALLISMALLRPRMKLKYERWRLSHGVLGALLMLIGIAHVLRVGYFVDGVLKQAIFLILVLAPVGLLVQIRLVRPLAARRRPYRVAQVRPERARVWTVTLEPVGNHRLRFRPGQFAWVTFGASPLSLRQNPFTIASSAEHPERLEFTIKELGDFTSTTGQLPVGSTAYIEGPAGNFTLADDAPGAVLIVGGIGITPAMSLLRTLRDRRDRRPVTLIYANERIEKAVFRDELEQLKSELPLRLMYVLEYLPDGWDCPCGYVTRPVLEQCLGPEQLRSHQFMICGPDPMMNGVELALRGMGVAAGRIRSERFDVV